MEEKLYNDLLIELECPVCSNYMSPPIRQCATGHSVCEPCRQRLEQCALCKGQFTESRNIALEGLAVKMKYPCINRMSGCVAALSYNEREIHELRCTYRGFRCGMEKCLWIGPLEELKDHWASKKITSKPYQASNVCHTKIKAGSYYVNIVEAHGSFFWFKCKLCNKRLYWAVQYIGKPDEAENFFYEIEVFRQGRTKRKILLSDYCQSIEMENEDLLKEGVCICVSTELVEHFVSDDQLVYYMRIHPVVVKGFGQKGEVAPSEKFQFKDKKHQRDRSKGPAAQNKSKELKIKKNVVKGKDKQTQEGFVVV